MKKRHFVYLTLFISCVLFAANLTAEVVFQVDASSRYIWRGFDLNPQKKPVIQPSIDFAFGQSGFSINFWSSISFINKDFNEFDLTLSYATNLSKDVSLTTGLIHYGWYLADNFKFKDNTSQEVFLSLQSPTVFLQPSFTLYYDFTVGNGIYLLLQIEHSIPLFERLSVILSTSLGYNGGQWLDKETAPGFSDLNFGITLPFTKGSFQISAFANYTMVLLETIGEKNHFWFGISLSCKGTRK